MVGKQAGGTNTLHAMAMAAVVLVTAFTVAYVVFDLEGTGLPEDTQPDATFGFAYDEGAAVLEITHRGGDTVDAGRIVILNEGFEEIGTWTDDDGITAGDSTTVSGLNASETVYVMWVTEPGEYLKLATWNGDGQGNRVGQGNGDGQGNRVGQGNGDGQGNRVGQGNGASDGAEDPTSEAADARWETRTATFLLQIE